MYVYILYINVYIIHIHTPISSLNWQIKICDFYFAIANSSAMNILEHICVNA